MTFIANTLFVIFTLFCLLFIVLSIINKDKTSLFDGASSERQEKNEDYNKDYYP